MKHWFNFFLLFFAATIFWAGPASALPSFADIRAAHVKSDSLLLDRNGEILYELRIDKHKRRLDWTALENISPSLAEAVLCSEDKRFYDHAGVDYKALGAAALDYLTGSGLRGASTITMQLVSFIDKDLSLKSGRRSIGQKYTQIVLARQIEASWTKKEILEAYLNLVTFRGESTGIAAASRGLFGIEPHGLDRAQSLVLASLVRAPNAGALDLLNRALNLNRRLQWQVPENLVRQKIQDIVLGTDRTQKRAHLAPHAARLLLKGQPTGTHVRSTLSARLQTFAAEQLARQVDALAGQNVRQGALLVLDNQSGDVLAYVSYSAQPGVGTFVDGVQAPRQTGSTLKPFLYATAIDYRILTAASLLDDSPLDVSLSGGIYQPGNYDPVFHGPVSVRVALASSLNIPAVKTLALVGTESFLTVLRQLGVYRLEESGDYYGLSLALGSADLSLWELTNAYRALANAGRWREARLIPDAPSSSPPRSVFSEATAFIVSDILADRDARSDTFGLENPLGTRFWTAVKTGTSKDMRDNWCVGFSPKYTVGVWVGNFSGESMWNVSGITGAAPVWSALMNALHTPDAYRHPRPPGGLVRKSSPGTDSRMEWFLAGTEPASATALPPPASYRILYPPNGTIIALDPDIPVPLQKVGFVAKTGKGAPVRWILNEKLLESGDSTVLWIPQSGRHVLTIADAENKIMDSVHFEVK